MAEFQILHISDLHINSQENFDRSVVLDPLIDRVKEDLTSGFKPEIIVVTGDIAYAGIECEYKLAQDFFNDLMQALNLQKEWLFLVPGNHDVDRKKYRPNDVPSYPNMQKLNEELENKDYRADLLKGMNDYFRFVETQYPHLASKQGRLIPFVTIYNATCKKRIGFVGLNSAWMCRRSPDEREIAIGEYQVKKALECLKEGGETDLVIHIFHHPLSWLWPEDGKICRRYFNNSVLLSGHLHDAEGGYYDDLDGSIYQFQAGGAYVGSESSYPNRFQYITFDWNSNEIRLDFRKFAKEGRKWCVEAEKGDDGKKSFRCLAYVKKEEREKDLSLRFLRCTVRGSVKSAPIWILIN